MGNRCTKTEIVVQKRKSLYKNGNSIIEMYIIPCRIMEVEKKVNINEINKIHFVHDYLDKGWQVHIQKPKKEIGRCSSTPSQKKMNRLVLKSMEDGKKRIVLSDDVRTIGYGGPKLLDESWLKENKRVVCIYSFLHNTLRKGWMIRKQKDGSNSHKSGTYCFSKPHKNQVKYLSQNYLHNFVTDNVNEDLEACFV